MYLVTTVTEARAPLFTDFRLARLAIRALQAPDAANTCRTLAFVLMPDHLHWMLELRAASLSQLLARSRPRHQLRSTGKQAHLAFNAGKKAFTITPCAKKKTLPPSRATWWQTPCAPALREGWAATRIGMPFGCERCPAVGGSRLRRSLQDARHAAARALPL